MILFWGRMDRPITSPEGLKPPPTQPYGYKFPGIPTDSLSSVNPYSRLGGSEEAASTHTVDWGGTEEVTYVLTIARMTHQLECFTSLSTNPRTVQ